MKDYLTMQEASLLIGKTAKTIKNYVKRGLIKNYFLVDGKYGQEYKISVRDLEQFGIACLEVLKEDFVKQGKRGRNSGTETGENASLPVENASLAGEMNGKKFDASILIGRYEESMVELGRLRERIEAMAEENKKLKQELEEKNMLIQVLMKKGKGA